MAKHILAALGTVSLLALAVPAAAQDQDQGDDSSAASTDAGHAGSARGGRKVSVQPYIEVSQIAVAELSPGNDVVSYTQLAAGVDASITGRNNGGSVSLRVEQNIGYGDRALDSTTVTGVARGYASIVPQALTVEGGVLAARTRVDSNGGATLNAPNGTGSESRVYSGYAGPNLHTRAGDVEVNANYRVGYTKVESPGALQVNPGAAPVDVFDESVTQAANVHLATRPGAPLPVGVGVGGTCPGRRLESRSAGPRHVRPG